MDSFCINPAELRPTLPPLASLNLPTLRISKGRAKATHANTSPTNDFNEFSYAANNAIHWTKARHVSTSSMSSSSTSSHSRTPSPAPSDASFMSTSSIRSSNGFRLVPCAMEDADAVVLVTERTGDSSRRSTLLLVGPAAQPYRQPSTRPATKGARVHPYKIAASQSLSRRSSMMSISSQLN